MFHFEISMILICQKYIGSKAHTKVLVELTCKLVEIQLLKKAVDKVFKMPDLQHFTSVGIFKKEAKKYCLNVKVPPNNRVYLKAVALCAVRRVCFFLLTNHKKDVRERDGLSGR